MKTILKSSELISICNLFNASDEIENFNFYKNLKEAITEDILIFGKDPKLITILDLVLKTEPFEILDCLKTSNIISND